MNPWKEGTGVSEPISVTLKYGKGYEEPWLVIKTDTVEQAKALISEATGLPGDGITLSDLVYNAAQHVRKINSVGSVLGGTVVTETPAEEPKPEPQAQPADNGLAEKIDKATSKGDLTKLYLDNKSAFDADTDLMGALQAKSATL